MPADRSYVDCTLKVVAQIFNNKIWVSHRKSLKLMYFSISGCFAKDTVGSLDWDFMKNTGAEWINAHYERSKAEIHSTKLVNSPPLWGSMFICLCPSVSKITKKMNPDCFCLLQTFKQDFTSTWLIQKIWIVWKGKIYSTSTQ